MKIPEGLWEFAKGVNIAIIGLGAFWLLMAAPYSVGKMAGKLECSNTTDPGDE